MGWVRAEDKRQILQEIDFGARVAEDEVAQLSSYFIETDQWRRVYRGDIDVVYGAKGAGKSAMFALLLSREDALFDRGILLTGVEDPRGAPAFGQLAGAAGCAGSCTRSSGTSWRWLVRTRWRRPSASIRHPERRVA